MSKKLVNFKAATSSIILALIVTLFVGCFVNAPVNMEESFKGGYWYYLNRGYPKAWSGLALANSRVDFPLVRMPLLHAEDGRGTELVKIVNIWKFIPLFMVAFFISYFPSLVFAKAVDENKKLFPFCVVANIGMLAILLFIYFTWFSRI